MKLNFRIDWGYQYLYSRRHYHPFYHWDGHLECSEGTIEKVFWLDYPVLWFGPGHSAKETQLESPCWKSTTHRGFAGIRIEADVADSAVIDPSREVFWNEWVEEGSVRRLMLLNTDWTVAGNRKIVQIDSGDIQFETEVIERQAKILTVLPGMVLEPDTCELHIEAAEEGQIRCHGTGMHCIMVHRPKGVRETVAVDLTRCTVAAISGQSFG